MKLRDQKAHISIDNAPAVTEIYETENTSYIEREINLDLLETALEELNKEQKTCITLFYLQKKSYHQISSITGFSLLQVKSNIQNGKRNLKILMEKKQSF